MSPIVIAGAGIAGLTLGKCLSHKGIPSLILERSKSSPRHSYGITLHPWAYHPLLQILHMDELTFRQKLAIDAPRGGTGIISGEHMLAGCDTSPGTFRCHRGRLERFLRDGQDIRWEHKIEGVEVSNGNIAIRIANEKPIEAKLLIGADGPHSQVRKSLAPDIELKVLPYVVFKGKRTMSTTEFENILAPQLQGTTVVETRVEDTVLQIAVNEFGESKVRLGYTYSRPARYPDDPLHKPDRLSADATKIPEDFYQEVQALRGLSEAFAEIFDVKKVREDSHLHWLMRTTLGTAEDSQKLTDQGVLLLGDAMHAMPILGGEGANFAIKDGVDLAEHLATDGLDGVKSFSNARFSFWKKGVEDSERRISEMHNPAKASL